MNAVALSPHFEHGGKNAKESEPNHRLSGASSAGSVIRWNGTPEPFCLYIWNFYSIF
jgi:hypothetical protein